ncbi:helix-turn-helix domain-containing protein [Glutamicibacter sp.]|uniref:MarR family winged helix-turn-helix transcriptional regulator n=1 Tax=Glutamicibacter sp. TaxID=1931995 RepID=UPI0028BEE2D5|nr:helix-turn-helix domain-containing protein [Glutamicibacter sp.]
MTRRSASALDDIQIAFARLGPLIKVRMAESASDFHPQLRSAGFTVLRMALINAARSPERMLSVSDIVTETQMDKSVVSRQLRDLKSWGLIKLQRSTQDARVFQVLPTKLAQERYRQLKRSTFALYRDLLGSWDEQDVAQLGKLLLKLVQDIEDSGQLGGKPIACVRDNP